MALTLRVTSFHSQALGPLGTKTFGAAGGSIGRNEGNDWVLPDPERFISGNHAVVTCRNGAFYLRDVSTNGTLVNGTQLSKGVEQPLVEGDHLQIGEYEVVVSIERTDFNLGAGAGYGQGASGPRPADPYRGGYGQPHAGQSGADAINPFGELEPPNRGLSQPDVLQDHASALDHYYQPPSIERAPPPPPAPDPHMIPDDWDKTGYSQGSARHASYAAPTPPPPSSPSTHGGNMIPDDWDKTGYSQGSPRHAPYAPPAPPPPPSPPPHGGNMIPDDWDKTGYSQGSARRAPYPPPAPPPMPAPPQPVMQQVPVPQPVVQNAMPIQAPPPVASPGGDASGAIAALLGAAGVDAATARIAAASPAMHSVIGTLLGVVVQGMLDVLKARADVKSTFRVPVTSMRPVENNPLKFSANAAQALQNLLAPRSQAYLGPVEAFDEGFQDIRAHQMAMMAGMRAAFDSMLKRFDPEELAERFEKRLKRASLINIAGKSKYWDLYRDLYEEWTQDADLNFQRLFGEKFAQAYEEQMRRLTSARR